MDNDERTRQNQHLYFLSDEEIKEGDWKYSYTDKKVSKQDGGFTYEGDKKIIATTDSSLTKLKTSEYHTGYCIYLPQPSTAFLEVFVTEYNKGNQIKEVLVEYEGVCSNCGEYHKESILCSYQGEYASQIAPFRLKVNSKDNTITIKKVKDSWNREELESLLVSHYIEIGSSKGCNLGQDVREWTKIKISSTKYKITFK